MNQAKQIIHSAALAICCVSMAACGTKYSRAPVAPPAPTPTQPVVETPLLPVAPEEPAVQLIQPTTSTPPVDAVRSLPAAIALRNQAASATEALNHQRAIGLLERAIRISPDDPRTYQDLAGNHLAMNRPAQALDLVRRGLSLNPTAGQRQSLLDLAERCRALL